MENYKLLNKKLAATFGKETSSNRPWYRLVWSEDEMEARRVGVGLFYAGGQEVTHLEKVRKYSYIKDRWILEKLVWSPTPELPESDHGHYEPLFVFQDKKGEYLKPIWKAIEIIVKVNRAPVEKRNIFNDWEEDKQQALKDIAVMEDMLEIDYIPTMLRNKEAIIVPAMPEKG